MKRFTRIFFITFILVVNLYAQEFKINKIEPPNWWQGIGDNTVQLMVYGENLDDVKVKSNDKDLIINGLHKAENSHYVFVDLKISNEIVPGEKTLEFFKNEESIRWKYPILKREFKAENHKGFWQGDAIYLITPDRFCNGNPDNDFMEGQIDEFPVTDLNGRHGGDLEGIISKLDYIKDLGATAVWVTPVLENDMWMSYHGYAITDLYKVDPRFGSNELYKEFVAKAHKLGMKVILDHVSNHIGDHHYWIKELPFSDWLNCSMKKHLSTNHNKEAIVDPHSDPLTYKVNVEGWFTDYMPDLNQKNPFLSRYLIQNTIWWMEYSGLDGIREDTYPYADRDHMAKWAKEILDIYPNSNIVGEVWKGLPSFLAINQKGEKIADATDTNLPSVTDFAFSDVLREYLSGRSDFYKLYELFALDFLYPNPENLVTFIDNHDISRAMLVAKENKAKFKQALTILLTSRGIPQIYYGTELGIVGTDHHGTIRANFPGGFPGDERNAFTEEGRTEIENELYNHIKSLLQLRKDHPALAKGKLVHYQPINGVYSYFKLDENEKYIVLNNSSDEEKNIPIEFINMYNSLVKINSLKEIYPESNSSEVTNSISIEPYSSVIYLVN